VSVDPLAAEYPFYTPYQYAGNQPVNFIDLDGLEPASKKDDNSTPEPKTGNDNRFDSLGYSKWKKEQKSDTSRYDLNNRSLDDVMKHHGNEIEKLTIKEAKFGNKTTVEYRESSGKSPDSIWLFPTKLAPQSLTLNKIVYLMTV
jgi:hypothetical protein